ncbi:MAG: 50S ribosomal protein L10 [Candidatus Omnitrophica bacterium CG11_big_fil_rev_8_21_14_0_20_64_10]|nr:MAG: 50S ribosomal protein L10 [Candidatus Omnitrophica bacterium CG11_big_fil_rev_8_21_14_0_20_64_10]
MAAASAQAVKPLRVGQQVRQGLTRDLEQRLSGVDSLVVSKAERVTAQDLNRLRRDLEGISVSMIVVKNSLCRVVFKKMGFSGLEGMLDGTCGVTPVTGDPAAVCRLLAAFAKDHEGFVLQGGLLSGQVLDAQGVLELSRIPSREILLSKVVGAIQGPLAGLVGVLNGLQRNLVQVLHQIAEKQKGV